MIQPQLLLNGMITIMLTKFMTNDVPHAAGMYKSLEPVKPVARYVPPEEKYRLVKRTKRGSLVVIQREGDKAVLEIANFEDMMDITNLLNASGIKWNSRSGIGKNAWEGTPAHLRIPRPSSPYWEGKRYPGSTIRFDFSDLEKVMEGRLLQPLMLED